MLIKALMLNILKYGDPRIIPKHLIGILLDGVIIAINSIIFCYQAISNQSSTILLEYHCRSHLGPIKRVYLYL